MVFSPFYFFVGDLAPAAAADRQCLVLVVNVEFDVAVSAFAVPRVFARFSHFLATPVTVKAVC
jgi:hypothetical protein